MRHLFLWRLAVVMTLAGLVTLGACGCHWLAAYYGADRHPMRDVKAEYQLTAQRLVIIPYASTEILFSDSTLSLEIAGCMVNEILHNLGPSRVKTIVHPADVNRWQESNLEWPSMSLMDMAKAFEADTVLYVELEHYSTAEERSANLYRGRVQARIQVGRTGELNNPVYSTTVETVYPKDAPVGMTGTTERVVRQYTNLVFARDVIEKFYEHKVEIRGGEK
jgi:hypothetical protein